MYDIRQFLPSLYVLIILGMSGFALALNSTATWVLSVGPVLLNAWLVATRRFQPISRMVASLVTVGGLWALLVLVHRSRFTPIFVIGQFLVLLQVVKLYEQRANRDYAQLLVLSLLLMVAASISTASLLFGLLLIAYLFLSLYCCLLFHLKVETDRAKQAIGIPENRLNPATLRQDQRYLPQSMRRLTALVSAVAITTAVGTFLFFPRGTGAGLLSPLQWNPPQTLTGFSESVSFQNVARITQNTEEVAWVRLSRRGQPYRSPGPLLLRGLTLDRYTGSGDESGGNAYQWIRSSTQTFVDEFSSYDFRSLGPDAGDDGVTQHVTLKPTGSSVLFAIGGIARFKPGESGRFQYSRYDEVLQAAQPIIQAMRYEVVSSGRVTAPLSMQLEEDDQAGTAWSSPAGRSALAAIDPLIEQYARRPEVSGSDAQGPLAARRPRDYFVTPLDQTIAQNIENHLRSHFTYTLDLTDARRLRGQDPLVAFLYELKRGHCEYFAGAMTLLCQSLGLQARMVVGFRCDEYNPIGGYYIVRQSHAHAWVEVLNDRGQWLSYDPTSGREQAGRRQETLWHKAKALFNYLQYTWANSVVAYDRDRQYRNNLMRAVDRGLESAASSGSEAFTRATEWLSNQRYFISSGIISGLIWLMLMAMAFAIFWFFWEKWKLRRRARRIGLEGLPAPEQMKLARQLAFYDELLHLLERRRITRPAHLTPLEFSEGLSFLPAQAYDSIRRLTDVYYRVRYGRQQLTPSQRRRLGQIIAAVESALANRSAGV